MRRSEAFPSKYLSKDDLASPRVLTINQVVQEEIEQDDQTKLKAVVYFQEPDVKPWIINSGNWMTVEDVYGEESNNWTGKRVELFVDPTVMFGRKRVGGVRVRVPNGQQAAPQTAKPQQQTIVAKITSSEVKGTWTELNTDKGTFYTPDTATGETLQSFGPGASVVLIYHLNPQGKQIIDTATLANEPATVGAAGGSVEEDDIPF